MKHHLIINAKNYEQSIGKNSLKIVKILNELQKKVENTQIYFAASVCDINYIKSNIENLGVKILAQDFDTSKYGSSTGQIHIKCLLDYGADGSLINHSERRLTLSEIKKNNEVLRNHGLISVICANNLEEAKAVKQLNSNFVAIEPPELIGGDVSVSKSNPKIIKDGVKICDNLLVGAGVKNEMDVKIASQIGAKGILVASGICKSEDPKASTIDLLKGFGELNGN